MKIVQAPDTVLSTPAQPIKKISKEILDLITEMKTTLVNASDPEGVGLAAPQVGRGLQLFIIKPLKESPISVMINPQVTLVGEQVLGKTKRDKSLLEGCLSLKDIWGTVRRNLKVKIEYMDESGKKHSTSFVGWKARIIQHEYDHLQGILFPKRVLEQGGKLYRSKKDEKGEEVFDLIEL